MAGAHEVAAPGARLEYLDRLRGVAVLIMIEAHVFDAWTRVADRGEPLYRRAIMVGGYGAPLFLFLAGIAISLAAGARTRKGVPTGTPARIAVRGLQLLGLAFLFRLQTWVVSGGHPVASFLKVDILNVMAVSMLMAAGLWWLARTTRARTALFLGVVAALAGLAPAVYGSAWLSGLPGPLEWYVRPDPGRSSFAIFPWGGFLLAGVLVGHRIDLETARLRSWRALAACAVAGVGLVVSSYLVSGETASGVGAAASPAFFVMRLGILLAAVPLAWAWTALSPGRLTAWAPLTELGTASLFVYWVHVELAYGRPSLSLHRSLELPTVAVGYVAMVGLMFVLIRVRDLAMDRFWARTAPLSV